MSVDRRTLLKGLVTAGAAAVTLPAEASEPRKPQAPPDAVGMLYDATLCIGCKTCVVACREANGLKPETPEWTEGLWDAPPGLDEYTKNVIQLYREGDEQSYVKHQCMHCLDPGCVNACMIGALQKREFGIVTWESDRCIGCRYCQVACPFEVPKFEFHSPNPKIVKCELCLHRIKEGGQPACCEVCPRGAIIYGKYTMLLEEAHRRLAANPDRYIQKVYGETDGGGTQVLYISHVPFEKLGFPEGLGDEPVGKTARDVQHGVYKGFIAPTVLYAVLAGVIWRNRRSAGEEESS